ncbi:MAG: hypothetical protein II276_00480 [Bacteroidales bacterium]|nr:hypothetical protein [Bacteroidales bacterium]
MKKSILFIAAAFMALSMSAQDLGQATEMYNNAAGLIQADKAAAVSAFKEALKAAEACEADADGQRDALIDNCKTNIVNFTLSIAKDFLKDKEYDKAYDQLKLTLEEAALYNNEEVTAEVNALIPTVYLAKGNQLLREKDALGAIDAYQKAFDLDPNNGKAALNLGQAYNMSGNAAAAEENFKIAMNLGEEKAARKQLSKMYLKKANAAYKAGNFNQAYDAAMTSNDYDNNANACKIAGNACVKMNNKAVAIECFNMYLTISPNAKDAAQIKETINILKK